MYWAFACASFPDACQNPLVLIFDKKISSVQASLTSEHATSPAFQAATSRYKSIKIQHKPASAVSFVGRPSCLFWSRPVLTSARLCLYYCLSWLL